MSQKSVVNQKNENESLVNKLELETQDSFGSITNRFNQVNSQLIELISDKIYRAESTLNFLVLILFICTVCSIIECACNGLILSISVFIFSVLLLELNKLYPVTNLTSVFVWGLVFLVGVFVISYIYVFTFGLGFIVGPGICVFEFLYCFYLTYLYRNVLEANLKSEVKPEKDNKRD